MNLSQATLDDLNELFNLNEEICELSKLNWCTDNRLSDKMTELLNQRHQIMLNLAGVMYFYYVTCVR